MRTTPPSKWLDAPDFSPLLLRVEQDAPSPLPRMVLWTTLAMVAALLVWTLFGRLDVVAVAPGRLLPADYVKVVQPTDQGIVTELLAQEGDHVRAGQVLARLDPVLSDADVSAARSTRDLAALTLRRIDAELLGKELQQDKIDPSELFQQVVAQYRANRAAHEAAIMEQGQLLDKAKHDADSALQLKRKLATLLPRFQQEERTLTSAAAKGLVSQLQAIEKERERISVEEDLRGQEFAIQSAQATIRQADYQLSKLKSDYVQKLQSERVENAARLAQAEQELAKQQHQNDLLELKAPQDGVIKEIATHTIGAVLSPGTVLLTLVPDHSVLRAEVRVSNVDAGFVRAGQPVKLKVQSYQFQKYGLLDGTVRVVSKDATERNSPTGRDDQAEAATMSAGEMSGSYRTLIDLGEQSLSVDDVQHDLASGMEVIAEIKLGSRSVMGYLLSPVQSAFHDAGRER
jgi:membrane fusion protein, hemolysin D